MELPTDPAVVREWSERRLLRVMFLNTDPLFLDNFVVFCHKFIKEEHVELIDGISSSFLQCLGQSRVVDDKYFVVIHALITCEGVRRYFERHSVDELPRFHAWHRFAESEMQRFRARLRADGKSARDPKDVYYPHLYHFVCKLRTAYLTGSLAL